MYQQIRAVHTDTTITVYQAYPPRIAEPALAAGRFVAPFKRDRMTWIKPSFRWMMYRCGWATKPDQEVVLAVGITRAGFEAALRDVTPTARTVHDLLRAGDEPAAQSLLPEEAPYPLPAGIAAAIGATPVPSPPPEGASAAEAAG